MGSTMILILKLVGVEMDFVMAFVGTNRLASNVLTARCWIQTLFNELLNEVFQNRLSIVLHYLYLLYAEVMKFM